MTVVTRYPQAGNWGVRSGLIVAGLALLLVLATLAFGQERFGSFIGTVTDPRAAMLPDVTAIIINKDTGRELNQERDGALRFQGRGTGPVSVQFRPRGLRRIPGRRRAVAGGPARFD